MALRASYYGLKKRILNKVLGDYDAAGVMTNKELTTNILTALFSNPVVLTSDDDLNNIKTPGIYAMSGSVPANAPTGMTATYSCLLVISTTADIIDKVTQAPTQIFIQGGWRGGNKHIALRGYGGSPSAWSEWKYIAETT